MSRRFNRHYIKRKSSATCGAFFMGFGVKVIQSEIIGSVQTECVFSLPAATSVLIQKSGQNPV